MNKDNQNQTGSKAELNFEMVPPLCTEEVVSLLLLLPGRTVEMLGGEEIGASQNNVTWLQLLLCGC